MTSDSRPALFVKQSLPKLAFLIVLIYVVRLFKVDGDFAKLNLGLLFLSCAIWAISTLWIYSTVVARSITIGEDGFTIRKVIWTRTYTSADFTHSDVRANGILFMRKRNNLPYLVSSAGFDAAAWSSISAALLALPVPRKGETAGE